MVFIDRKIENVNLAEQRKLTVTIPMADIIPLSMKEAIILLVERKVVLIPPTNIISAFKIFIKVFTNWLSEVDDEVTHNVKRID